MSDCSWLVSLLAGAVPLAGAGQDGAAIAVVQPAGHPWTPVLLLFIVAVGLTYVFWLMGSILGPKNPNPVKSAPFEYGNPSFGWTGKRYTVKFYLVGISFLLFDLEAAFVYPWAVTFRENGLYGLLSILLFLGLVTLGLVYEWRKGALEWE